MTESEKREYLHKILDLIIDINGFEARDQGKTGHKPTAFLKLYGHVNEIEIKVHPYGWSYERDTLCEEIRIPLGRPAYEWDKKDYNIEEAVKKLTLLRDELGCNDGRV